MNKLSKPVSHSAATLKRNIFSLAILVLAGCQSGPAAIVFKPGVDVGSTVAAIDECKIQSFKEIPQSIATDVDPGYNNPGNLQCNTIGNTTSCYRVGAVNIPATTTTYDVNQELRDRYVTRCLEANGFKVKLDGRICPTQAETEKALVDRAEGRFPQCAIPA